MVEDVDIGSNGKAFRAGDNAEGFRVQGAAAANGLFEYAG